MEGLTGHIMFNDDGKRCNYTLHVVQMTIDSTITKVRIHTKNTCIMYILFSVTNAQKQLLLMLDF